ncbi:MAG: hypothetical protein LV480_04895 [Methylacidiphilales bacterium]|nr:hypothetical protein [Candidatus Methylacidiphilales bacterium]
MSSDVENKSIYRTSSPPEPAETIKPDSETSASELFDLYERIVETRPGTRDAEIFEKIREWTFSDFTLEAHEFAGVTEAELVAWARRNRINLSAGHIRPDPIDIERGHAWGHIRRAAAANRLHSQDGPPSAHEVRLSRSKIDI